MNYITELAELGFVYQARPQAVLVQLVIHSLIEEVFAEGDGKRKGLMAQAE